MKSLSTKVRESQIEIDGEVYTAREPMREDMDAYRELVASGRTPDSKEDKVGFATADAALAARCLSKVGAPVAPETFNAWPWRVQKAVIDEVDALGELLKAKPEVQQEAAKNSPCAAAT